MGETCRSDKAVCVRIARRDPGDDRGANAT